MKLRLKYYPQHTSYSCGPVALRMIFEHLGKKYSEEKLILLSKAIPNKGTSHKHMIEAVKNENFEYIEKSHSTIKDVIDFLDKGYPVLVNYFNPLSKCGHYSIIKGYDSNEKILIFADPANGEDYTLHWDEFQKLWHNSNNTSKGWMLIIGREKIN